MLNSYNLISTSSHQLDGIASMDRSGFKLVIRLTKPLVPQFRHIQLCERLALEDYPLYAWPMLQPMMAC
jgi:hypothetical protein